MTLFTRLDEGGFFKTHRDTPRSSTMFASLVVVFPTAHEGGALKLCHGGNEWTVNSATATAVDNTACPVLATSPSIAMLSTRLPRHLRPPCHSHMEPLLSTCCCAARLFPSMPNPLVQPKTSESELALKAAFTRLLSD
jgi:hypothetical protein